MYEYSEYINQAKTPTDVEVSSSLLLFTITYCSQTSP